MSNRVKIFFAFLLLCGVMVNAYAAGGVRFDGTVIPLTPGENGIAFMTVTSAADDTILSVHSECCAAVELHQSTMENGIMQMRMLESVKLKAGAPTVFAPGGTHVMLIGIKRPLKIGDRLPLTFTFARAPKQTVLFTVAAPRLH